MVRMWLLWPKREVNKFLVLGVDNFWVHRVFRVVGYARTRIWAFQIQYCILDWVQYCTAPYRLPSSYFYIVYCPTPVVLDTVSVASFGPTTCSLEHYWSTVLHCYCYIKTSIVYCTVLSLDRWVSPRGGLGTSFDWRIPNVRWYQPLKIHSIPFHNLYTTILQDDDSIDCPTLPLG